MAKVTDQVVARIRDIRRAKGWSQEKLAEEANLSRDAISRIERGDREPRLETLHSIAKAVGLTLSKLLDFEYQPKARREQEIPLRSLERALDQLPPWLAQALIAAIKVIAREQARTAGRERRRSVLPAVAEPEIRYGKRSTGRRRSRRG